MRSSIKGQFYYLYLVVDVFSRIIVGGAVHEEEPSHLGAGILITEACLREGEDPEKLILHSDNGGPMKGATILATLQLLGIVPSFSRPKISDDNAYSEVLFRTLKYRPEYPSVPFQNLEEARSWVSKFVRWYNYEHRNSGIKFVTPVSRHSGEDESILLKRKEAYEEARKKNPTRLSQQIRNWDRITDVRQILLKGVQEAGRGLKKSA